MKNLDSPIVDRDLRKQAPHSSRVRLAGFAIATRAVDKCRASLKGKAGEYHFDCPLDNMLFSFKGVTGEQFKSAVETAKNYEDVGAWLLAHGTAKTGPEIEGWSDEMEGGTLMKDPEKRAYFVENCTKLKLNPEQTSTFDWLEADDRASFTPQDGLKDYLPLVPATLCLTNIASWRPCCRPRCFPKRCIKNGRIPRPPIPSRPYATMSFPIPATRRKRVARGRKRLHRIPWDLTTNRMRP